MQGSQEADQAGSEAANEDWPPVDWETHTWIPSISQGFSRTQRRANSGPYLASVPQPIAHRNPLLPSAVLAEAEEAAAEIGRFDSQLTARLDNPHLAPGRDTGTARELGPMTSILLRTESASSSQIENLTVGARQLALAEIGESAGPNARLVARNVAVLRAALRAADQLNLDTLLELHHTLLDETDSDHAGQLRTQQVWIGGNPAGPHQATFVPPHHDRVPAALDDLFAFIARDDLPVLAQAAIAHAQFETIHPFTDGNGRTGRAIVHAMLRSKSLTRRVTVPVSAGLLTDISNYFDALGSYRLGDATKIVQQFSRATLTAIANGQELITDLDHIQDRWSNVITARRDAAAWRLTDLLIAHPVVTAALVSQELSISAPAAQNAIRQLTEIGILTTVNHYRRNRVWQAQEILTALDDFAARTGRRQLS